MLIGEGEPSPAALLAREGGNTLAFLAIGKAGTSLTTRRFIVEEKPWGSGAKMVALDKGLPPHQKAAEQKRVTLAPPLFFDSQIWRPREGSLVPITAIIPLFVSCLHPPRWITSRHCPLCHPYTRVRLLITPALPSLLCAPLPPLSQQYPHPARPIVFVSPPATTLSSALTSTSHVLSSSCPEYPHIGAPKLRAEPRDMHAHSQRRVDRRHSRSNNHRKW